MEKVIVYCPKCRKKMKITNKTAKYKCPNCSNIYNFNSVNKVMLSIKKSLSSVTDKGKSITFKIKKKFNDTKATHSYLKQVKKNMKKDPNWSNYRNQQKEVKDLNENPFKKFLNKFKK